MITFAQLAQLVGCSYEKIRSDAHDGILAPTLYIYSKTEPRTVEIRAVNEAVAAKYIREQVFQKYQKKKARSCPRMDEVLRLRKEGIAPKKIARLMKLKRATIYTILWRAKKREERIASGKLIPCLSAQE